MVSEHVDQERNRRCRRPAGRRRGVEALSASAASRRARGGHRDRGGRPGAASWRGRGRRRRLAPGTETPIRRRGGLCLDAERAASGYCLGVGERGCRGSARRRRDAAPLARRLGLRSMADALCCRRADGHRVACGAVVAGGMLVGALVVWARRAPIGAPGCARGRSRCW